MIGKIMMLSLAVMSIATAANEVHYHYHMDGDESTKPSHKGYKACAFKAYSWHAGCMTLAIFSAAKRAECRAKLAVKLADCKAQNPTESRRLSAQSERALSKPIQHKGYKLCAFGAYSKNAGCMSLAIFSAEKRAACRATLASRLADCRVQFPATPSRLLTTSGRHDRSHSPSKHGGFRLTLCNWNSSIKLGACKVKASFGGTDAEKAQKKAACQSEHQLRLSECAAKHSLAKLQRRALSKDEHLLFCTSRAKNSWFWCDFWAKLRGGDQKAARVAECEAKFNTAIAVCDAQNAPANQTHPAL